MSIKIGINGTASFNALKDLIVGTSTTAKKDINFVKDWNGTIIWQRDTRIELNSLNTSFNYQNSWSEESSAKSYQPTPYPYVSTKGDGHITYTGGSSPEPLTQGMDYDVSWINNRVPATGEWISATPTTGTGTMRITGKGSYKGTIDKTFSISYKYKEDVIDITNNCTIDLLQDSKTITNDQSTWTASKTDLTIDVSSVWLDYPFKKLTAGTDYTIEYEYPDSWKYEHDKEGSIPKTVTVKVTGKGSYKGSQSKTYTVTHKYEIVKERLYMTWYDRGDSSSSAEGNQIHIFEPGASTATTVSISASGDNISGIAYGNQKTVVISYAGCKWSYNKTGWTSTSTGLSENQVICFTNGKFIVCGTLDGSKNKYAAVSSDAITWNLYSMGTIPGDLYSICGYGNTIVCQNFSYSTASNVIFKSTDSGQSWTYAKQGSVSYGEGTIYPRFKSIRFINNFFVANAFDAGEHAFCRMGISDSTFTSIGRDVGNGVRIGASASVIVMPIVDAYTYVAGEKKFINGIRYSQNLGDKWTDVIFSKDSSSNMKSVNYINGKFYALSSPGQSSWKVYSSDDGINWSLSTSITDSGYLVCEIS